MNQILFVEDNPEQQAIVKKALGALGVQLFTAGTAHEALNLITREPFELVLLDLMLPDTDGFSVLAQLQGDPVTSRIPVLILTGREELSSKVTAFSLGADDYILKPFNPIELRARVESKLRKVRSAYEQGDILNKGAIRIDLGAQRVFEITGSGTREIKLTTLEFKLLVHLAKHEGKVRSRDQILDAVWGDDVQVFDRTVDTHVSALRKKLGPLSCCVESVTGTGYRFVPKTTTSH